MNVGTMLKYFFKLDIKTLTTRTNNLTSSVWFYHPTSPSDAIHLRFMDETSNIVLRLYSEYGGDYKITYQSKYDNLRFSTLTSDSVLIQKFMEVTNLEEWFQRTTVEDLSGMEFDDFLNFRIMFDEIINIADKKLNG